MKKYLIVRIILAIFDPPGQRVGRQLRRIERRQKIIDVINTVNLNSCQQEIDCIGLETWFSRQTKWLDEIIYRFSLSPGKALHFAYFGRKVISDIKKNRGNCQIQNLVVNYLDVLDDIAKRLQGDILTCRQRMKATELECL